MFGFNKLFTLIHSVLSSIQTDTERLPERNPSGYPGNSVILFGNETTDGTIEQLNVTDDHVFITGVQVGLRNDDAANSRSAFLYFSPDSGGDTIPLGHLEAMPETYEVVNITFAEPIYIEDTGDFDTQISGANTNFRFCVYGNTWT